eukprot:2147610-Pyramimonas_sp.AAC.1
MPYRSSTLTKSRKRAPGVKRCALGEARLGRKGGIAKGGSADQLTQLPPAPPSASRRPCIEDRRPPAGPKP